MQSKSSKHQSGRRTRDRYISSVAVMAFILVAFAHAPFASAEDSTFILVDIKEARARTLPTKIISKPQTTCPVSGNPLDKRLHVDHKGKRIYVCSRACLVQVKKNPRKYLQKLAESGQGVETVLFPDDGKKPVKKAMRRADVSVQGAEK